MVLNFKNKRDIQDGIGITHKYVIPQNFIDYDV